MQTFCCLGIYMYIWWPTISGTRTTFFCSACAHRHSAAGEPRWKSRIDPSMSAIMRTSSYFFGEQTRHASVSRRRRSSRRSFLLFFTSFLLLFYHPQCTFSSIVFPCSWVALLPFALLQNIYIMGIKLLSLLSTPFQLRNSAFVESNFQMLFFTSHHRK